MGESMSTETQRSAQANWRKHVKWAIPLVSIPVTFVACLVLASALSDSENAALSLVALLAFLAAFALPIVGAILAIRGGHRVYRAWRRSRGSYTRGELVVKQRDDAFAAGWAHGIWVRKTLIQKELPPEISIWGLVPWQNERFFLDGTADFSRFYGMNVAYTQSNVIAFGRPAWVAGALIGNAIGNSASRTRAQQAARTQWREHQAVRVLVSNQRIVCQVAGRGWLTFAYSAVSAVYPDPEHFNVVFEFDSAEPLSLTGPLVPALASIAILQTHGHEAVTQHPALQGLS